MKSRKFKTIIYFAVTALVINLVVLGIGLFSEYECYVCHKSKTPFNDGVHKLTYQGEKIKVCTECRPEIWSDGQWRQWTPGDGSI